MTKAKRFTAGDAGAVWVSMGGASMQEASTPGAAGGTPSGVGRVGAAGWYFTG